MTQSRRLGSLGVVLRLLRAACSRRPGAEPIPWPKRLAHFVRCAMHMGLFRDWFGATENVALQQALERRPWLALFAVHPYMNLGWSAEDKLSVIAGHYWLLRSDPSLIRLNAGQAVALAETVDGVQVRLDRLDRFAHEGELTLSLFRGEQRLYTLVFTLGQIRAERVVYVGALQGLQSPDALEIYRALTQGMHGLRPRDLLLTAFRECCACLDIRRILAVSDRCRVSSSPYFKSSAQVLTSYDSAWIESGGHPADDGFFELARSVDRRGAADIPTRKRAAYRRRYAMVDGVLAQIRLSLGVL